MNILITNIVLTTNSGTELYVKELALELSERGHCIEIFTYFIGELGQELVQQNINVTNKLELLKLKPDIIHAHHNLPTQKVAFFFKHTPIIYFLHDRTTTLDHPFSHKNIIKYVAVDHNVKERYTMNGFKSNDIQIIYNWFNPYRFYVKKNINIIPKKALIFSNYIDTGIIFEEIRQACVELNIELDIIGLKSKRLCAKPEDVLPKYDLVFGKAKAGIEAMATGACLIVCDYRGLGETVTLSNIEYCRKYNFGMKLMRKSIKKDLIIAEIKKYNSDQIEKTTEFIRETADFFSIVTELETTYIDIIQRFKANEIGKYPYSIINHIYIYILNMKYIIRFFLMTNHPFLFKVVRNFYNHF